MLTPVLTAAHKNGVRIGKIQKTVISSRRSNMTDTSFHIKNIKFDCLNLLLKPEKGKIFRRIIIFYSIEFFIVIIVTDKKCSIADNFVLAT